MGSPPPQLSPDGRFYWDGTRWIPIDASPPAGPASGEPGRASQIKFAYGGLLIRFVAYLIDALIISIPTSIFFFVLAFAGVLASPCDPQLCAPPPPGGTAVGAFYPNPSGIIGFDLVAVIITGAYFVYFWGTSGSSLGMRLLKLRVVDANDGHPIGIGRAIVRYVGFIVAALPCWVGLIWAAFDSRAQGWHDKMASTVVLRG